MIIDRRMVFVERVDEGRTFCFVLTPDNPQGMYCVKPGSPSNQDKHTIYTESCGWRHETFEKAEIHKEVDDVPEWLWSLYPSKYFAMPEGL